MNTKFLTGMVLVVLGILVLVFPDLLRVVVGLGLVLVGLYIAMQNPPVSGNL